MTDGMLKELEQYCKPFTLLFVEDDAMLQKNVQRSLGLLFNKVIVAGNGKEGLEAYKSNDIDLVLSDINMPIMTGIEMTKKIKEIRVNQPIIILSAHKDFNYIYDLLHLGISAYSVKDGDLEDLFYKILIEVEKMAFEKYQKFFHLIIDDNKSRKRIATKKSVDFESSSNLKEFKEINKDRLSKEQMAHIDLKLDEQDIEEAHDLSEDLENIVGSIFMTDVTKEHLKDIYDMFVKFHNTFYTFLAADQRKQLKPFADKVQNIITFIEVLDFDSLNAKQKESLGLLEFMVEELMKFIDMVVVHKRTDNMYYIGKTLDDNLEQIKRELGILANDDKGDVTLF
jgi:DNA-binding NarL/FixJ family response regulator